MKNRCERVDLQMEIQNKEEINFHNFMKMIREKKGNIPSDIIRGTMFYQYDEFYRAGKAYTGKNVERQNLSKNGN